MATQGNHELQLHNEPAPILEGVRAPAWLWLSLPIAIFAIAAGLTGMLFDSVYSKETANWAAQGFAQDIVNVFIAYPALLVLAFLAGRGSIGAYLAWTGVLGYSVYTFAIYTFSIHLGPLFMVYVAVFGLSIYALIGGLASIDGARLKSTFTPRAPIQVASTALIVVGVIFYLLWLSEIVPTVFSDTTPQALIDTGLPTNPVHVLDMAILLPAALITGVLLKGGRATGYLLAPMLLGTFIVLGIGIVGVFSVLASRGEVVPWGVAGAMGAIAAGMFLILIRFVRAIEPRFHLSAVIRSNERNTSNLAARGSTNRVADR